MSATHHHFTCVACGRIARRGGPDGRAALARALRGGSPPSRGSASPITASSSTAAVRECQCRGKGRRGAAAPRRSAGGPRPRVAAVPRQPTRRRSPWQASAQGHKSHDNLKEAFAGESQANRRYLYFARVADIEGFPDIAGLFKDTADAETGHAFGHLDFLKEVGDPATGEPIGKTEKNLKSAVAGETYEYTQMYPGMAKTARDEGFAEMAEWFETLAKAEKSHAGRFAKGLNQVAGKDPADAI